MKFISVQPALDYYTWQVEVMLNNFIENGVDPRDIQIICTHTGRVPESWKKLDDHYKDVNFYFYRDERVKPGYISSVRPHALYQHWLHHPELEKEVVFYHDCDILLTKPVDYKDLEEGLTCYVSDTVSYIGANYIRSKGERYLNAMCNIVNVNPDYVISQEKNSGGAQYILKYIPKEFWKKVYYDCENLFRMVTRMIQDEPAGTHALQIWCADMWAVLWNLWFFNRNVEVSEKMSFSWATSSIDQWDKHPIFHNAGVTGPGTLFYKAQYMNALPYDITLDKFSDKQCSYKYAEQIIKTAEKTCLK